MNQQIRNQNESTEKCILESSHSENVSKPVVKEALKSIKVYIPSDNYDSQLSFEQNLAQGGVKLFNEIPASDIGIDTPFSDCMTVPLIRSKQSELNASGKEQNASKPTSPSDFDSLIDPSLQRDSSYENEKPHSYSGSSFDYSQQNISSPESEKYHSCDVCLQGFARRRDLALHYLTHTDKEKRRAAKKIKKCDICGNKQCNCKSFFEKMYPNYSNMPTSLSVAQPENTSTIFIQAESMSGNTSLIKRDLFHCPDCDQKFGLESQLKQHSLVHKRERAKKEQSFSCNLCTQKFSDQNALTYHISTVHPSNSLYTVSNQISQESQNIFPIELQNQVCKACRTIFNDVECLKKHLKRLGWVCNICSTYFCQKTDFQTHYMVHLNNNTSLSINGNSSNSTIFPSVEPKKVLQHHYKCCICNKNFKFLSLLKTHCSNHALQKVHFCQWCRRKCKQKISAHIHYFRHKKVKNVCRICNKCFFLRKSLKIHIKTHLQT